MHAVVELILGVVVWMAVAALNHFGVQVRLPREEPVAERVIHRDPPQGAKKADIRAEPCPPTVRLPVETRAAAA